MFYILRLKSVAKLQGLLLTKLDFLVTSFCSSGIIVVSLTCTANLYAWFYSVIFNKRQKVLAGKSVDTIFAVHS
jgi:hypothetical protein